MVGSGTDLNISKDFRVADSIKYQMEYGWTVPREMYPTIKLNKGIYQHISLTHDETKVFLVWILINHPELLP